MKNGFIRSISDLDLSLQAIQLVGHSLHSLLSLINDYDLVGDKHFEQYATSSKYSHKLIELSPSSSTQFSVHP